MNRRLRLFPLAIAALAVAFVPAASQAGDFGLRGGVYLEDADPFVGVEGLFQFGSSDWFFNPNAEAILTDDRDRFSGNLDFHYDFFSRPDYSIWAGGGLAVIHTEDDDLHDSDDEVGANFLAGVAWMLPDFRPYARVKVVAADDAEIAAAVGIRF